MKFCLLGWCLLFYNDHKSVNFFHSIPNRKVPTVENLFLNRVENTFCLIFQDSNSWRTRCNSYIFLCLILFNQKQIRKKQLIHIQKIMSNSSIHIPWFSLLRWAWQVIYFYNYRRWDMGKGLKLPSCNGESYTSVLYKRGSKGS